MRQYDVALVSVKIIKLMFVICILSAISSTKFGKVIVGLVLHRACITASVVYQHAGSMLSKVRCTHRLHCSLSMAAFSFAFTLTNVVERHDVFMWEGGLLQLVMWWLLRSRSILRSFSKIEWNWYCDFLEQVWLDCDATLTPWYWSNFEALIRCRKRDPAVNCILQCAPRQPWDSHVPAWPHPVPTVTVDVYIDTALHRGNHHLAIPQSVDKWSVHCVTTVSL